MRRRDFIKVIGGAAATWPVAARAQQKSASIGFLVAGASDASAPLVEAFKQGLRENGLIEGKNYAGQTGTTSVFPRLPANWLTAVRA